MRSSISLSPISFVALALVAFPLGCGDDSTAAGGAGGTGSTSSSTTSTSASSGGSGGGGNAPMGVEPPPPGPSNPGDGTGSTTFIVSKLFLGDAKPDGTPDVN